MPADTIITLTLESIEVQGERVGNDWKFTLVATGSSGVPAEVTFGKEIAPGETDLVGKVVYTAMVDRDGLVDVGVIVAIKAVEGREVNVDTGTGDYPATINLASREPQPGQATFMVTETMGINRGAQVALRFNFVARAGQVPGSGCVACESTLEVAQRAYLEAERAGRDYFNAGEGAKALTNADFEEVGRKLGIVGAAYTAFGSAARAARACAEAPDVDPGARSELLDLADAVGVIHDALDPMNGALGANWNATKDFILGSSRQADLMLLIVKLEAEVAANCGIPAELTLQMQREELATQMAELAVERARFAAAGLARDDAAQRFTDLEAARAAKRPEIDLIVERIDAYLAPPDNYYGQCSPRVDAMLVAASTYLDLHDKFATAMDEFQFAVYKLGFEENSFDLRLRPSVARATYEQEIALWVTCVL